MSLALAQNRVREVEGTRHLTRFDSYICTFLHSTVPEMIPAMNILPSFDVNADSGHRPFASF